MTVLCEVVDLCSVSVKQSFNRGDNGLGPNGTKASSAPYNVWGRAWFEAIIRLENAKSIRMIVGCPKYMPE